MKIFSEFRIKIIYRRNNRSQRRNKPGEKYWWDFDLAWSLAILEPFWYKSEYSNGSKIARPYGTPDIS